jgi:2-dehydropantoate 2-reductase
VGAGGTGGYFGGRLLEAGRDVTFLVRARRAALLAEHGLVIKSPHGDFSRANPPTVQSAALRDPYDLIILSCKAYDLESAMDSFAAAVGPDTAILPLLNGMQHLDALEARFGAQAVLGGVCMIASTIDDEGRVLHLNDINAIFFGERDGARSARAQAIEAELTGAKFKSRLSDDIIQEMWEKWVFIATGAGITSLMRSTVGDIEAAGGAPLAAALLDECARVAAGNGHAPGAETIERSRTMFTLPGSSLTASMYRDIERGARTEGEHILGDLLRRSGDLQHGMSLLRTAYVHVMTYEARRARLAAE